MKKLFSALLAGVLVAASAISVSAGMYVYDDSDGEYWDAALNMLEKTDTVFWMEDGSAANWSISVNNSVEFETNKLTNLESGWYEVVFCDLGTNEDDFPEDVEGKIAFALRGDSTFTIKSDNALNAGAVALIVGNNCRDEESVDEEGNVTSGSYQVTNMTVEYETLPMGMVSSDVAVRLVSTMADISIADSVTAIRSVFGGELSLGLEGKNSAWLFLGTEEEYKANTTRTDANTKSGTATVAAAEEEAPVEEETPVVEEAPVEEVAVEETPATTEETVEVEAPAEEETVEVEAPAEEAPEETVEEAPQTFDFGVIAAVAAIVSAAGYAISKKR